MTALELRRDGAAVLREALGPAEVGVLRAEVADVLARPLPPGCERPHNTLAPLRWDSPIVTAVLGVQPLLSALAGAVSATDLRWISAYASIKEPHSDALWWHQDWWCWDHPVTYRPAPAQVALLCYLGETDSGSGALRVIPGSHRRNIGLHAHLADAHSRAAAQIEPSHPAMTEHGAQVTVEARAGDAVVADYRVLHGTHPNLSARRRDCVLLSFTPDWNGLPDNIRAHLIRHPALPSRDERPAAKARLGRLLPRYSGVPRDLPLRRDAPAEFALAG